MNPSLDEAAIRGHLKTLRDADIIEVLDTDDRNFYTLTDEARGMFDEHGLFPEEAWQRQYDRVEKTARLRELESVQRPNTR